MISFSSNDKEIRYTDYIYHIRKNIYFFDDISKEFKSSYNSLDINEEKENEEFKEFLKTSFQSDITSYFESNENNYINKLYFLTIPINNKEIESKITNQSSSSQLFTKYESKDKLNKTSDKLIGKKIRSKVRQPRFRNQDNMRIKIQRNFLKNLRNAINQKLKKIDKKLILPRFPQNFAGKVNKVSKKLILNMTLLEILEKKEYCKNLEDNLKLIKKIKENKTSDLNDILNKKFRDLYIEYIESKEFNIDEIERLRNSKNKKTIKDEKYLSLYKDLANNFIKFLSEEKKIYKFILIKILFIKNVN